MTDFTLGDRVAISGTVRKLKYNNVQAGTTSIVYSEGPLPVKHNRYGGTVYNEGIVVGRRFVQDGTTTYHPDGTAVFKQKLGTARRVWLIAYDLRYSVAQCFDHQLQKLHSIDEVAQHLAQQDEQLPGQLTIEDVGVTNNET